MRNADTRKQLRLHLVDLIPEPAIARLVCEDTGLDTCRIGWHDVSMEVIWQRVIAEAERSGKLVALLNEALERYPSSNDLRNLLDQFREGSAEAEYSTAERKAGESGDVSFRGELQSPWRGIPPEALGRQEANGWELSFSAPVSATSCFNRSLSSRAHQDLQALTLLAQAEGCNGVTVAEAEYEGTTFYASLEDRQTGWLLRSPSDQQVGSPEFVDLAHLLSTRFAVAISPESPDISERADLVVKGLIDGAKRSVSVERGRRLGDVDGHYLDLEADDPEQQPVPALEALDIALKADSAAILLHGPYGSGKSTVLAEWCHRRVGAGTRPIPIFVNLGSVDPGTALIDALTSAAGLIPDSHTQAKVAVGIQLGLLLPVLDGFDEWALRLGADRRSEFASMFALAGGPRARVVVSVRDTLFNSKDVRSFFRELCARQSSAQMSIRSHEAVAAVVRWLEQPRRPGEENAARRAVELVRDLARDEGDEKGWIPEGAQLEDAHLAGMDLRHLQLVGARLHGADLRGALLSGAVLTEADMSATDLTNAEADQVVLTDINLRNARLVASTWTRCRWEGARLQGADVTASAWTTAPRPGDAPGTVVLVDRVRSKGWVAWSPDGRRIATDSTSDGYGVWDADLGRLLLKLARQKGPAHLGFHPKWSRDGRLVGSWWSEGDVIWDAWTGACLVGAKEKSADRPERARCALAWDLVGRFAAYTDDGHVAVWDIESGELLVRLEGSQGVSRFPENRCRFAGFSPNGKLFGADSGINERTVWNTETGARLSTYRGEVHTCGGWLHDDGLLHLDGSAWNFETGFFVSVSEPWKARPRHEGLWRRWCVKKEGENFCVRDRTTGAQVASIPYDYPVDFISPEGERLLRYNHSIGLKGPHQVCRLERNERLVQLGNGLDRERLEAEWSPDGKLLAASFEQGVVWMLDCQVATPIRSLQVGDARRCVLSWSPDSKWLAVSSEQGSVWVSDCQVGTPVQLLHVGSSGRGIASWSPDGSMLASVGDGKLIVWKAGTFSRILTGESSGYAVWSPDSRYLAVSESEDRTVAIWDVVARHRLSHDSSHRRPIGYMTWSFDSNLLAAQDEDGVIAIWDART